MSDSGSDVELTIGPPAHTGARGVPAVAVSPESPAIVIAGTPVQRKVAARVEITARRVVFHLAGSYPYQEVFRRVQARVLGVPAVTPGTG